MEDNMRKTTGKIKVFLFLILVMVGIAGKPVFAEQKTYQGNFSQTISDDEGYYLSGKLTWIRLRPTKDGCLKVKVSYGSKIYTRTEGYIQLYDAAKKQRLSKEKVYSIPCNKEVSERESCVFYGLKKNKVYYLRFKAYDGVKIKGSYTPIAKKTNNSMKKAVTLKTNRTVKHLLQYGKSETDWYRIVLKKPAKIRLSCRLKIEDKLRISLRSVTGAKLTSLDIGYTKKDMILTFNQRSSILNKTTKLNAGTYYICVKPLNKKNNGYYSLKWKV